MSNGFLIGSFKTQVQRCLCSMSNDVICEQFAEVGGKLKQCHFPIYHNGKKYNECTYRGSRLSCDVSEQGSGIDWAPCVEKVSRLRDLADDRSLIVTVNGNSNQGQSTSLSIT